MKKMVKNQKGFSLIELLIVIAIMGVLAIIAFNAFSGVVNNVKKRADDQNAKLIEKALTAYIIDSGDVKLENMYYDLDRDGSYSDHFDPTDSEAVKNLIIALMCNIRDTDGDDYKGDYGPYLSPEDGKDPDQDTQFELQWSKDKGGDYESFKIDVYTRQKTVTVKAVTDLGGSNAIEIHED